MPEYSFEQFTATRRITAAAYSPDGAQIAYIDDTTGQLNLWLMPSGGGIPRQMTTFSDHAVRGITWSPDGQQLAITVDEDGNELTQIFLLDARGSWPRQITDNPQARYMLGEWSPDGKSLLYSSNDDKPHAIEPVLRDMATGSTQRLMTGGNLFGAQFSPDGRYVTVVRFYGNTNQDIFVYEIESGEAALVTPHEGEIQFRPGGWKADSSGFYILTNQGREYMGVGFYDLKAGTWEWVFTPDADVEGLLLSEDGSTLVYSVNEGGRSVLYGLDLSTQQPITMPDLPLGVVGYADIAHDGSKMVFLFGNPREANNLYELDLKTGELVQLGQSMLGGMDRDDLVVPDLVHYETFDGQPIPAWLYKPRGDGPFPVVLSIHGGPEAQERPTYAYYGLYQYLLTRGIGVLAPNIRGSSGYGISYQKLIHRDWGGDELKDIEHAAQYLQSLDWVDNARIAIYGGSFGGFATLSAMTRLPDYWAVGVDLVGPSNLVTFAKSVPEFWKEFMRSWVGDPEDDYDMLMQRSPITYVDNIKAPLLVIQGANDPRVVQAESDQMVERMRANGQDVTYFVDEEEGHGTTRRENALIWFRMVAEYLEAHLLPEARTVAGD